MRVRFFDKIQLPLGRPWPTPVASQASPSPDLTSRPHTPLQRVLRSMQQYLLSDLRREAAVLVPLRGFIGLGWLRAAMEKVVDPGWADGSSLTTFLLQQEAHAAFPAYQALMTNAFLPHTMLLSWIILIGQLLAGAAIVAGFLTRAALIGALFMNINFLLAGVPNPSAFYLVIQGALLMANTGMILGVDGWLRQWALGRRASSQAVPALSPRQPRRWLLVASVVVFGGIAGAAAPYIRDFSPAGSVHDPAMLVVIVSLMAAVWAAMSYVRR
ncbi:MAG: hypothetical protein H7Y32_15675 [Chloroflexales bacterium]|nr:hypothetical protein [Chloroflexales bacterium]